MCIRKIFLSIIVVLAMVSVANADLILTVNGLNATNKPLEINGKSNLVIAVAGSTEVDTNAYFLEVIGGVLGPITDPNSVSAKAQAGDYLFTFDERGLGIINLIANQDMIIDEISVANGDMIYQLVLFYLPERYAVIALGANLEAINFTPPSQPKQQIQSEQQASVSETTSPATDGSGTFFAGGIGDCNEVLDPNWFPNLNKDQFVNFKDFAILATNWLLSGSELDGDINGNEIVDFNDLAILAYYWLANACGPSPEEVFESFKAALLADDVNEAVSYFAEVSAESYLPLLEQLRPYFTQMINDMGELVPISSDDNTAVYDLLREEDEDTYGYPVLFVRDEKGQWKIYDF